jgi:hypothetical protein
MFGIAVFVAVDMMWFILNEQIPSLRDVWYFSSMFPVFCGMMVTIFAGGLVMWKRFASAAVCGGFIGFFSILTSYLYLGEEIASISDVLIMGVWRAFAFAVFAAIGAIIAEINLPDPDLRGTDSRDMGI